MTENIANNAVTQLQSSVTPIATTIAVLSSTGFPSPNFRILIDSELMLVTAVSENNWTVTRAVENTTATTHSINASVACVLTVAGLDNLLSGSSGDYPTPPSEAGSYRLVVDGEGHLSWVSGAFC